MPELRPGNEASRSCTGAGKPANYAGATTLLLYLYPFPLQCTANQGGRIQFSHTNTQTHTCCSSFGGPGRASACGGQGNELRGWADCVWAFSLAFPIINAGEGLNLYTRLCLCLYACVCVCVCECVKHTHETNFRQTHLSCLAAWRAVGPECLTRWLPKSHYLSWVYRWRRAKDTWRIQIHL